MKAIYISLMGVAVFANQKNEKINKFYDGLADIQLNINEEYNCQTAIDNQLDLLCDGFQFCDEFQGTGEHECVSKDKFKTELEELCGAFDHIQYDIKIDHSPKYGYDNSQHVSFTFVWQFRFKDEDCKYNLTERHTLEFNDNGLITKLETIQVGDAVEDCPQDNKYIPEPEPAVKVYGEEPMIDTPPFPDNSKEKEDKIYEMNNEFGRVLCKKHKDTMNDMRQILCDDIEYISVCNDVYSESCSMLDRQQLHGRQAVLDYFKQYEDNFDEVIVINDDMKMQKIKWRKGQCHGEYKQKIDLEYDETNKCISQWIDHNDDGDIEITDQDGKINSLYRFIIKLQDCQFDDQPPVPEYPQEDKYIPEPEPVKSYGEAPMTPPIPDAYPQEPQQYGQEPVLDYNLIEKENKISEMNDEFGRVLCNKHKNTMNDIDMKHRFCDNMKYSGVCNNVNYDCSMFKQELHGRQAFLDFYNQWVNYFDEVTMINDDMNMYEMKWRKGQCQGEFKQRTKIEYDEQNHCISQYIEYFDEVQITDKDGNTYANNSPYEFTLKLENECEFDLPVYDDAMGTIKYQNLKVDVPIDDPLSGEYMEVTEIEELEFVRNSILELEAQIREQSSVEWVSISLEEAYVKDICDNRMRYRCRLAYVGPMPEPEYLEDGSVTQVGGGLATGYIEYDVVDVNKEKQDKISEMCTQLGQVICKKHNDKMHDLTMKQRFCEDMEYIGVCNDDSYDCDTWKKELHGREAFLDYFGEWENMFDEVSMMNDGQMFEIKYRKGQCQGNLKWLTVDIEYDSDRQCISQWIDHIDDGVEITDQDGLTYADNSLNKFIQKIQNECTFDGDDNVYGQEKPSTTAGYGQGSGLDNMVNRLVKKERADKLRLFYKAAFDCRLKQNAGNTALLDKFMSYLADDCKLCVVKNETESCYDKDKIRTMMSDRYVDDNEKIDYDVDIISNDGDNIESVCTSRRKKPNGCIVIKQEEDYCSFNPDGSIKEFKVMKMERRTECDDAYEEPKELGPVAVADYASTSVNEAVIINVLNNDYDPDHLKTPATKSLLIKSFTSGDKGLVQREGDQLKYIPNNDECGNDKFVYTIVDADDGLTDSANVHIDIECPPKYPQEDNKYIPEPEPVKVYGEAPMTDAYPQENQQYGEEPVYDNDYMSKK